MKNESKKAPSLGKQWSDFFHLIKKAKIPWYLYILTFLLDAVSSTLFVKVPVLMGQIMQGDIYDNNLIVQFGFLSAGNSIFGFAGIAVFAWVSMMVCSRTAAGIWTKILHIPMARLDQEGPSKLTTRVTNDYTYVDLAIGGIFNFLSTLYAFVLLYVEMFKMHTGLAAALLAVPVWLILSMVIIGGMSYRAQKQVSDAIAALTSYLAVRLPNMRAIKAFGTQKQEQDMGQHFVTGQYAAKVKLVQIEALSVALKEIASAVCNIVVIAYGAYLMSCGQLELSAFVTFFLFATQGNLISKGQNLMLYYQNIKLGMGGCGKISELIETEEEQLTREKSFTVPEADITFDHVTFGYGGEKVLKDVSLTIPKGKITAIVGPNGSGKTTILKLLERLYTPDSGSIAYGGVDIERYHLNDWRGSIGYVVQNSPLLIGTVTDNICYGLAAPDRAAAEAAAREVGADEFIRGMEQGYDTSVGELGGRLSGGQRQKLAIARALAKKPDMYLLDEATCGLDACNEREITEFMNDFLRGRTAVIVAHNLDTIRMADQIIVLKDGQVDGVGTHQSLLDSSELYRKFCGVTA